MNLTRTSGLESAINIQKAAEQYLDKLIPELCESDHEVANLERQIREFELNRKAKMNGNANNIDKCKTEKDHVSKETQKLEKLSPPRMESPDNIFDERRTLKDNFTATVCII